MKKTITGLFLIFLALSLSACAKNNLNKSQKGVGIGAATGAVIGQAIGRDKESTLLGASIGLLLGYMVGNEMDKQDLKQVRNTFENGVSGRSVAWQNPDNGNQYRVTPKPAFKHPKNKKVHCRQADILATINGEAKKIKTTACRNKQGVWVIQN